MTLRFHVNISSASPRCAITAELHLFCDVSIKSYGTIAFLYQKDVSTFVMVRGSGTTEDPHIATT